MKPYLILKSFTGSQDGITSEAFEAGTTRPLPESLVRALGGPNGGYIREAEQAAKEISAAPHELAVAVQDAIIEAEHPATASVDTSKPEEERSDPNPADSRETKVVQPEETKPATPAAKKRGK